MIVITDTSPVNYPICIGQIEVLPALYSRVPVPLAVCEELKRTRAPNAVRLWIASACAACNARAPLSRVSADGEVAATGIKDHCSLTGPASERWR
jgi:hypothetical protein